jgi:hypothetical protein
MDFYPVDKQWNEYPRLGWNEDTMIHKPEDWPGDAIYENGKYQCRCEKCRRMFTGLKRRVLCRICHEEFVMSRLPENTLEEMEKSSG